MTLASELIQDGLREGNLIPVGEQPTDAEQMEALGLLNRFYLSVFGNGFGEQLTDWLLPNPQRTAGVAANYPQAPIRSPNTTSDTYVTPYPPINSRVVWGRSTSTVWFPEAPCDGSRMSVVQGSGAATGGSAGAVLTVDGNGRLIDDQPTVTLTAPLNAPARWTYRADLAAWRSVSKLAIDDEMPFPESVDDLWILWLAVRLAPRYGKTVSAETTARLKYMQSYTKALYQQSQDTVYRAGEVPNSLQSYGATTPETVVGWPFS